MGAGFDLLPDADEAEPSTPLPQSVIGDHLRVAIADAPIRPNKPGTILFTVDDPAETMMGWARGTMGGRELGGKPLWVRFFTADQTRGLAAVLHSFTTPAEMELVVFGNPGMLCRTVLGFVSRWAFFTIGLRRLVLRIPVADQRLQDYARRAGFHHEGTARSFFEDGGDASLWAMTARDCPWLGGAMPPAPVQALAPPSNVQVH